MKNGLVLHMRLVWPGLEPAYKMTGDWNIGIRTISLIMGLHASSHVAIMTLALYCHASKFPSVLCDGVDCSSLTLWPGRL